jgi:hypothetical protein
VCAHFVNKLGQAAGVTVTQVQNLWIRLVLDGAEGARDRCHETLVDRLGPERGSGLRTESFHILPANK